MARIAVTDDTITVRLGLLERLVGNHNGDIVIDRAAITSIERVDNARLRAGSVHFPGVEIPGVIKIGQCEAKGHKQFASTQNNDPGYVITTSGEPFPTVIVSHAPVAELDEQVDTDSSDAGDTDQDNDDVGGV